MSGRVNCHPRYTMDDAIGTAVAAVVLGSVVNQVLHEDVDTQYIRIRHPGGILECGGGEPSYRRNLSGAGIQGTFYENVYGQRQQF